MLTHSKMPWRSSRRTRKRGGTHHGATGFATGRHTCHHHRGSRISLSGEGCRAGGGVLHAASRFHVEAPTASSVCQRLVGRRVCPLERSRSIGIAPDAKWSTSGTRWVEPHRAESDRFARLHRRTETRRGHASQRDGGRSGRPADPDRRSGRQSRRTVRAGVWSRAVRRLPRPSDSPGPIGCT